MVRYLVLPVALFFSCLILSLYSFKNQSSPQQNLNKYLPEKSETGEWRREGSSQEYKGDDLFLYIDGGAEIYHEYGFKQVIIQDFLSTNEKSISLEIFEMTDSQSAYGMYTFKTDTGGKELALGDEARLADYYLNFWKGNYLVTITGFDEDEETIKGLQRIGQAVEGRIKTKGEKPPLATMLPKKNLVVSSIKYFEGILGLYNSYPFFTKDVFAFQEGIKGDYETGYSIYIVKYKNNEESLKRFSEVKKSFKKSLRYKNYRVVRKKLIRMEDSKGKFIFISLFKKCLLIVIGTLKQSEAEDIIGNIKEEI